MASEVVTKSKRKECWDSRDSFYACLDSNNQDESKCKQLQSKYEAACPKTWRQRFADRRAGAPIRAMYNSQPMSGIAETNVKK